MRLAWMLVALAYSVGCRSDDVVVEEPPRIETGVDTGYESTWSDLSVQPDGVRVSVGAAVPLRVRGTAPDGSRAVPPDVLWSVEPSGAGRVESGLFHADLAGEITLRAAVDGVDAEARITVESDAVLEVRVLLESEPLEEAEVWIDGTAAGTTGVDGVAVVAGLGAGSVDVAVLHPDVVPLTIFTVVTRDLVAEVRPRYTEEPAGYSGTVDFSALDAGPGALSIGWVVPAVEHPWWSSFDALMGPNRTVKVLGVEVDLPVSLAVGGVDEGWSCAGGAEEVRVVATSLPIEDALAAGSGGADPVSLVASHLDAAATGVGSPTEGVDELLTLTSTLDVLVEVPLGRLPDGAQDSSSVVVLGLDEDGSVLGLGTGLDRVTVHSVSEPSHYLAFFEDGGLGSGGSVSVQYGETLRDFLALPGGLELSSDQERVRLFGGQGDLLLGTVSDRSGRLRDFLAPGGIGEFRLSSIPPGLDFPSTRWQLRSVALDRWSFDGILAMEKRPDGVEPDIIGLSYTRATVSSAK